MTDEAFEDEKLKTGISTETGMPLVPINNNQKNKTFDIWTKIFSQIIIVFLLITGTSITIWGSVVQQVYTQEVVEEDKITKKIKQTRTGHWGLIGGGLAIIAFASGVGLYNYSPPFVFQLIQTLEVVLTEYLRNKRTNDE